MKKIAVILCGSGYRDGSEIRESVGVLWALSQFPVSVQCFAPDGNQRDVINCLTNEPMVNEKRNMLVEAARIARGKVLPLNQLTVEASQYDGIILPGGFGAAKNLCDFAFQGSKGNVQPDLKKILESFHSNRKPIGAVCIAPAILALAFTGQGFELSVGEACEASREIETLGHKHVVTRPDECHFDSRNNVATTPAYMYDGAPLHEIFEGIRKLVAQVVQ